MNDDNRDIGSFDEEEEVILPEKRDEMTNLTIKELPEYGATVEYMYDHSLGAWVGSVQYTVEGRKLMFEINCTGTIHMMMKLLEGELARVTKLTLEEIYIELLEDAQNALEHVVQKMNILENLIRNG